MSDKIQAYVEALLKNPEFIKTAAHRYGPQDAIQTNDKGAIICNISMIQLAKAVIELETAFLDLEPEAN